MNPDDEATHSSEQPAPKPTVWQIAVEVVRLRSEVDGIMRWQPSVTEWMERMETKLDKLERQNDKRFNQILTLLVSVLIGVVFSLILMILTHSLGHSPIP